jgi:hypothetical protein
MFLFSTTLVVACQERSTAPADIEVAQRPRLDYACSYTAQGSSTAQTCTYFEVTCEQAPARSDCQGFFDFVLSEAFPGDGSCAPNVPCGDGGGGGGGGGIYDPYINSITGEPCDYLATNPPAKCQKVMSIKDKAAIEATISRSLRTTFSDPVAQQRCGEMVGWLRASIADSSMARGANSAGSPSHWGQSYGYVGHLDPRVLDPVIQNVNDKASRIRLLNTALHEAAHMNGYKHLEFPTGGTPVPYTSDYFNLLNNPADWPNHPTFQPNPNSCAA